MITQKIDPDEEFINPNLNYQVLMGKMRVRILNLEDDIKIIKDPVLKGYAVNELISLRKEYFGFLKTDLELQHLVLSNPDIYGGDDE